MPKHVTAEMFKDKASRIHGSRYDYTSVNYIDSKTKVQILCHVHGIFWQRPFSHISGSKCPSCARDDKRNTTIKKLLEKASLIHNGRYDYSKVQYISPNQKVEIICPIHGSFFQLLHNHVSRQGCPLCGSGKKRTTNDFIILAKEIHGELYDYSQSIYKNSTTPIKIICRVHGVFYKTPDLHCFSSDQGCPNCKVSKGVCKIVDCLKHFGITNIVLEKTFERCKNPKTGKFFKFDIFLPDKSMVIEYDGEHHTQLVNYTGKMSKSEMSKRLSVVKRYDVIKENYLKHSGIQLVRIRYTQFKEIESIIKKLLNY